MAVATLTLGGQVTGLPAGTMTVTAVWGDGTAPGELINYSLATGDNTIPIPAGTSFVLITPPVASTVVLCLKGAGSDYGITFAPTPAGTSQPMLVPIQSGQTTLVINAASTVNGITSFLFL
jgi:hypothetical protein